MTKNNKNKLMVNKRNAAKAVALTRNGGAMRHKNDRRKNDARNSFKNQEW